MKKFHAKTTLAVMVGILGFLTVMQEASAQADSTTGNRAGNWNAIIPRAYLDLPPQPTPIVNNITNTTQQITQVIQPSVSISEGSGDGIRFANAYAGCGGVMLGGGGSCQAADGYASMPTSQPNGNGWQVICDAFQGGYVIARAWATCSN